MPLVPAVPLHVPEVTTAQTVVVSVSLPEDPDTVMLYAPAVVEAVVVAVSVAVSAVELVMSTDVGERLHVAGLVALVGPLTEQVRLTVPVKELEGVAEMVEVLPVAAPGLMEMLPLLERAKLVPVVGGSQNPLHPAKSGRIARKSPAHLACLILARLITARIPAPCGAGCGPDSPVAIAN
jgi:hypothetical protein